MYDYSGLFEFLKNRNIKKSELTTLINISSRTIAKFSKGEKVSNKVINKLCSFFDCDSSDLYKVVTNNILLDFLRDEKNNKISGGIYHELQIRMTYNSNHIEGSTLNEDQTRKIFETNTIVSDEGVPVDDIIETVNHFRAIDYCIDIANEELSEKIIKKLHLILKSNTHDEQLSWFNVGDYKLRPNMVGGNETTSPKLVEKDIKKLLKTYLSKNKITIEDIIEFHYHFEKIHPFQDGNGRVGRLIAFKESLKHNIIPFIIEDRKKYFYYRGLQEWKNEKGFLVDTCLDGQDTIKILLKKFEIDI